MKLLSTFLIHIFLLSGLMICAQSTTVLFPSKDAMIRYTGTSGDSLNYGDYEYVNMHAWTNSGTYVVHRSMLGFDLSSVNPDTIQSAHLKLFSDKHSTFYPEGHQSLQEWPLNDLIIQRIVEAWDENTVNWVDRPDITFEHEIYVPPSMDSLQDYDIDVTEMLHDMLMFPEESHGFMLRLRVEAYYNRVVFASSDNAHGDFHPRLEITYASVGLREHEMEAQLWIFPNPAEEWIRIKTRVAISGVKMLEIIDITGRSVISVANLTNPVFQVDVSSLKPGLYCVRLFDEAELLIGSERLVLQ